MLFTTNASSSGTQVENSDVLPLAEVTVVVMKEPMGGWVASGISKLIGATPVLVDVDTREELAYAERQLALRDQYMSDVRPGPPASTGGGFPPPADPIQPRRAMNARSS